MSTEFTKNMEDGWRDWSSIVVTDSALGTACGAVGYMAVGSVGLVAAAPLIANIAKNSLSRLCADIELIDGRVGFFAVEVVATAALSTITFIALSSFAPGIAVIGTIAVGTSLLFESFITQMITESLVQGVNIKPKRDGTNFYYNYTEHSSARLAWKAYSANNPGIHECNDMYFKDGVDYFTLAEAEGRGPSIKPRYSFYGVTYNGFNYRIMSEAMIAFSKNNPGIHDSLGCFYKSGKAYGSREEAEARGPSIRPVHFGCRVKYNGKVYRNMHEAMIAFSKNNQGIHDSLGCFYKEGKVYVTRIEAVTATCNLSKIPDITLAGVVYNGVVYPTMNEAMKAFSKINQGVHAVHGKFYKEGNEFNSREEAEGRNPRGNNASEFGFQGEMPFFNNETYLYRGKSFETIEDAMKECSLHNPDVTIEHEGKYYRNGNVYINQNLADLEGKDPTKKPIDNQGLWTYNGKSYLSKEFAWIAFSRENTGRHRCGMYFYVNGAEKPIETQIEHEKQVNAIENLVERHKGALGESRYNKIVNEIDNLRFSSSEERDGHAQKIVKYAAGKMHPDRYPQHGDAFSELSGLCSYWQ